MLLTLTRCIYTDISTIGTLSINGESECWILEDTDRGLHQKMALHDIISQKVHGKTAIPYGKYEIVISYSNRFKRLLPLLNEVPGYEGIRIHSGNIAADTEGCLLPGKTHGVNVVNESRIAFQHLFDKIKLASENEKVYIEIKKGILA